MLQFLRYSLEFGNPTRTTEFEGLPYALLVLFLLLLIILIGLLLGLLILSSLLVVFLVTTIVIREAVEFSEFSDCSTN